MCLTITLTRSIHKALKMLMRSTLTDSEGRSLSTMFVVISVKDEHYVQRLSLMSTLQAIVAKCLHALTLSSTLSSCRQYVTVSDL